jgi:putative aldouronate transport system permease protein
MSTTDLDRSRLDNQERRKFGSTEFIKHLSKTWELYIFVIPALVHIFIFKYLPIYGVRIAFTDGFSIRTGRSAPEWNNFAHFVRFFNSAYFWPIIRNTLSIAFYRLALWPAPLILALMMNQVRSNRFKKTVQMVTYAPHFISTVVVVAMMYIFLSPRLGVVNTVVKAFTGGDAIYFMGETAWAKSLYVWSGIWQNIGYGAIIYIAALSSVDVEAKEAAYCDGASKLQIIWHVEISWIRPTIVILFIMRIGHLLTVGFEKILLMQNSLNVSALEVVATYVYKAGIQNSFYDFAAAVGLMEAVINFILLMSANKIAKLYGQAGLW